MFIMSFNECEMKCKITMNLQLERCGKVWVIDSSLTGKMIWLIIT